MADIPVYLFLGFLDGGKTKFIHDTLCDKKFQDGDKTLCILFEDGEEELDTSEYALRQIVNAVTAIGNDNLNHQFLTNRHNDSGAERVIIESNCMWTIQ